jgi:hypothetical protein
MERFRIQSINGVQKMAKKNSKARKPSGAAGIAVIDDDLDDRTGDVVHENNGGSSDVEASAATKPGRKTKPQQQSNGNFAISDIKKAAAFANSIGGLDKAIAVLQILKVAKEVQ